MGSKRRLEGAAEVEGPISVDPVGGPFRLNLHFSPRGEAKCVRGPSGLGEVRERVVRTRREPLGARRRT